MYTDCYHPLINGVVTSIDTLKNNLQKLGHEVALFVPGVRGHEFNDPSVVRFVSSRLSFQPDQRFTFPIPYASLQHVLDQRMDIVHVQTPFNMGLMGRWVARRARLPFVITHHTLWEEYTHYVPLVNRQIMKEVAIRLCRNFCNAAEAVIAPSVEIRDRLLQQGVRRPIWVLPTGIDPEAFQGGEAGPVRARLGLRPEHKVLIYVGRLGREKSLDFLLRAFKQVAADPLYRLLMVGDGPMRSELEAMSGELGVAAQTSFVGFIKRDELKHLLAAAQLFVFASTTETQGLVSIEAMAAGLPLVAVRGPGSSEVVIDGQHGFLVAPEEAAFAAAIRRIMDDAELRGRLGRQAVDRAWQYSSRAMAEKTAGVYQEALEGFRADVAWRHKKG